MKSKEEVATEINAITYSFAYKKQVVDEIEQGLVSMRQACIKYSLHRQTVQRWFKKYGSFDKKLAAMGGKSPKQEIQVLRKQVKDLELEKEVLDMAIDIVSEIYGEDVRKKYLPESLINGRKAKRKS